MNFFNKTVAVILLPVVLFNYIRIVGPFFDYMVNYDYIVSELCVQKDEEVNDCCGSCVLNDNVEKIVNEPEHEKKENLPPNNLRDRLEEQLPTLQYHHSAAPFAETEQIYTQTNEFPPAFGGKEPLLPPPRV
ncbi:MAG: hypothetical protein LC102_08980 [Ignavibacteriales bacterium]|jgi:hypothetical protein|nr:MAG: hypothetical protein F9K26_05285 [Ignavibacteriaceae bacterium]MBW7872828.1 hypothetical protein [Ignavibacteria bacterium]MCZ2143547.1 hypothetical protein [Ignavibacteriales bacterium]MBV6444424.1 hypothetical protein [Ignavibacteriaceae bacterium]MBZ0197229.1 hypothetical protein [Ignavibacteriaceae bacterium]